MFTIAYQRILVNTK